MKSNKVLTAKVLEVRAKELNPEIDIDGRAIYSTYSFEAYEFKYGVILIPSDTSNDWFFECRDDINPGSTAVIEEIIETDATVTISAKQLLESIQSSIKEYGMDSVPERHLWLWGSDRRRKLLIGKYIEKSKARNRTAIDPFSDCYLG